MTEKDDYRPRHAKPEAPVQPTGSGRYVSCSVCGDDYEEVPARDTGTCPDCDGWDG